MVHDLPEGKGTQVTVLTFGSNPLEETVTLTDVPPGPVVDMVNETIEGDLSEDGRLVIRLEGYGGMSLRVASALPPSR